MSKEEKASKIAKTAPGQDVSSSSRETKATRLPEMMTLVKEVEQLVPDSVRKYLDETSLWTIGNATLLGDEQVELAVVRWKSWIRPQLEHVRRTIAEHDCCHEQPGCIHRQALGNKWLSDTKESIRGIVSVLIKAGKMRMFGVGNVSDCLPDWTRQALILVFQTEFKVAADIMKESKHGPMVLQSNDYPFSGVLSARTTHDLCQAVATTSAGINIHFSRRADPYPSTTARQQKQRIIEKFASVLRNKTEKQMLPKYFQLDRSLVALTAERSLTSFPSGILWLHDHWPSRIRENQEPSYFHHGSWKMVLHCYGPPERDARRVAFWLLLHHPATRARAIGDLRGAGGKLISQRLPGHLVYYISTFLS